MSNRRRILIVDDDRSICEMIRDFLEMEGYDTAISTSGEDAIRLLSKESFDVVLTDLMMPGKTGIDVLSAAQSTSSDTSVIMMTGYATVDNAVKTLKDGAVDYLTKPVSIADIDQAITRAIAKKEIELARKKTAEANEKLRKLDRLKSNFVNSVSHELRTPLTSIKGFTHLLLDSPNIDSNRQREFLNIILNDTERLIRLVEDLLDFSNLELGKIRIEKSPVDLRELINLTLEEVKKQFANKKIEYVLNLPETLSPVLADKRGIKKVMMNLISNAIKFSPPDTTITITAKNDSDKVFVAVKDEGMGIPPSDLPYIFDEFYRVDRPGYEIRGTGLGLAIVKQILSSHGGSIKVKSEVGKGSEFSFYLPISPPSEKLSIIDVERLKIRTEIEKAYYLTTKMITETMDVEICSIMLLNENRNELRIVSAHGLDDEIIKNTIVKVGDRISGWIAFRGEPLLVENIEEDRRFGKKNNPQYKTKSLLSVPLKKDKKLIGVLNVNNKVFHDIFTERDLNVALELADKVSFMVSIIEEYRHNANLFIDVIKELEEEIEKQKKEKLIVDVE